MEILIVILLLPSLGGLMLLVDWHRKSAMDREARDFGRSILTYLGWIVLFHGLGFGLWTVLKLTPGQVNLTLGPLIIQSIARLILTTMLLYAGWSAIRVGKHDEREDLDLETQHRRALESESLWISELLLVGMPLLIPGAVGLFVFLGFWGLIEVLTSLPRAAQSSKLLWSLSLAASNGRPFHEELQFLAEREKSPAWRRRYHHMAQDLHAGDSLTSALMPHSRYFPSHVLPAISVAEEQGSLRETLLELAARQSETVDQYDGYQSMATAIFMAWFLLLAWTSIAGFVCYWIVPKYKAIFNDFGVELPAVTQAFLVHTDILAEYWYLVVPLLSLPILFLIGLQHVTIGAVQGRAGISSRFFPWLDLPNLLRSIQSTVVMSAPLPRALKLISQLQRIPEQSSRISRVSSRVEMGDSLGTALRDEGFLASLQSHAIDQAERLGQLPWCLQLIADQIDRRRLEAHGWLVELIHPVITILVSLAVLYYCVAFFAPLAQLIQELS